MGLVVITPPTAEPLSLQEAKDHLRVTHNRDDSYLLALIGAVRAAAEQETRRSLITRTLELQLDAFPAVDDPRGPDIRLTNGPFQSITSLRYVDQDGATQTMNAAEYTTDLSSLIARVRPVTLTNWPATYDQPNAVAVRYIAGYGANATAVPAAIRHWMLVRLAGLYEFREPVVQGQPISSVPFIDALLDPFRVPLS